MKTKISWEELNSNKQQESDYYHQAEGEIKVFRLTVTLVAIIAIVSLAACSSDDDSSPAAPRSQNSYTEFMRESLSLSVGERANQNRAETVGTPMPQVMASTALDASYSITNVQITGVDEADLVKFDGDQLLYLNRSNNWNFLPNYQNQTQVSLFKESVLEGLENEDPQFHYQLGNENAFYRGLLTHESHAALIGHASYFYTQGVATSFVSEPACMDCIYNKSTVVIKFWQYEDENGPIPPHATEVVIDGNFVDSRAIGNKLYIVSQFQPSLNQLDYYPNSVIEKTKNQKIINSLTFEDVSPYLTINGHKAPLIGDTDCSLPDPNQQGLDLPNLVAIVEFDFDNPQAWRASCAAVGYAGNVFVSRDHLYLFSNSDGDTEITKYALTENGAQYRARGSIATSFNGDSYRLGEVQGKLVFVNTVYDERSPFSINNFYHQLSVFEENNGNLKIVAQIPNQQRPQAIGKPGESIYAVRIFDERAYIVTFREVDPLYAIDLSNPYDPQVLGALEIPGYSSYLHPVSDDIVLGIGKNAIPDSNPANTFSWYQGLSLRVFSVADPRNPILLQSLDYGMRGSESEVLYDPHAFTYLLNQDTGIARFTLPMTLHGDAANPNPNKKPSERYDFSERGLYQFELDTVAGVISERNRFLLDKAGSNNFYISFGERAVINGDSIYYAHGDTIDVIPWGENSAVRSFNVTED